MDPDPDSDPTIFVIDLKEANKKHLHHFSKIKSQKKVTKDPDP